MFTTSKTRLRLIAFGGDSGGGSVTDPDKILPSGFKFVSSGGKLQLFKGDKKISEQDEYGSEFATSVQTGTGSFHLGDLHSNGSGGENVIWKNTDSDIAYYPSWAGTKVDGSVVYDMTARSHGALVNAEPNGVAHASTIVNYDTTFTASADVAFFYVDIILGETYSGKCNWIAKKTNGKEVASFFFDVNQATGSSLRVPFKYPLWVKSGQQFTIQIKKADGSLLSVRAGVTDVAQAYRKLYYRTFTDKPVLTDVPPMYDPNKTIRHVYDCNTTPTGTAPAPAVTSTFNSGLATQIAMEDNRPCVFEFTSSTTANSSCSVGFVYAAAPPASNPTLTVYFKTPTVMNASTTIQLGTNSQNSADRTGLEIIGSTLQGKVVIGGTTTQSGGTYTVAANTWYIARIIYTSLSGAVCKLYSETGTELYSFTITVTMFVGTTVGLRASNSGTVAVSMCKVDMIELVTPISNRFYLPV